MDQLYISNLPFQLSPAEIAAVFSEWFPRPTRVTCLKRGPYAAHRRQSAFCWWPRNLCPHPRDIDGWLPQGLVRMGWSVPLRADFVRPATSVSWQHLAQNV